MMTANHDIASEQNPDTGEASVPVSAAGPSAGTADRSAYADERNAPINPGPSASPSSPEAKPPTRRGRQWLLAALAAAVLALGGYFLAPWVDTALNTVSTDDAYVNGHVTFVAPRVPG